MKIKQAGRNTTQKDNCGESGELTVIKSCQPPTLNPPVGFPIALRRRIKVCPHAIKALQKCPVLTDPSPVSLTYYALAMPSFFKKCQASACLGASAFAVPSSWKHSSQLFRDPLPFVIQFSAQISTPQRSPPCPPHPEPSLNPTQSIPSLGFASF